MSAKRKQQERPEDGARPCLNDLPYRMIVFDRMSQHDVPLYRVAGSAAPASGAHKALQTAFELHGGNCHYCSKQVEKTDFSIDHAEPLGFGGGKTLQNLLIACRPCNAAKGGQPIEMFHPEAGRAWLTALLKQVQDRLDRLGD